MVLEPKAVRGMHDLIGIELAHWNYVETKVKHVLQSFGYFEIRTPVLEKLEVFSETVGDETDIVEKQMYRVQGSSESENPEVLVLRPEGTASFVRAVLEHQLHRIPKAQRFFYYAPMFRHERPQKGRLRQFHQFGAELILDPTPEADVEIIALIDSIGKNLGFKNLEASINSVGCQECRPAYKEKLKSFLAPSLSELCEQCQKRYGRSALRILDCKKENCQSLIQKAPKLIDCLCTTCQSHHTQVKSRLKLLNVTFVEDPRIVRGLDYYSRTAFEFTSNLLGAQSALAGGGRYDGLSARFGATTFPAVGFGLGMERLMLMAQAAGVLPTIDTSPKFFFAALGEAAFQALFALSFELKQQGIQVEMVYEQKGLKNLLKQADRSNAPFALILGDDELKSGQAIFKDMKNGTQTPVPLSSIKEEVIKRSLSCS